MAEGQVPVAATYLGRDKSTGTKRYTVAKRLADASEASVGNKFQFDTEEPCVFSFGAIIILGKYMEQP